MLVSREKSTRIADEIEAALLPILEKHGMSLDDRRWKYGEAFGMTIKASPVKLVNGVNVNAEPARVYLQSASWDTKLDPAALGREFQSRGETYVFMGEMARGRKYRWLGQRVTDGAMMKFSDGPLMAAVLGRKVDA